MEKKRGRPKKDGSRNKMLSFRLNDDEYNTLAYMSYLSDKSITDVIREALDIYKKCLEFGE